VREIRTPGSVRGAVRKDRPYRDVCSAKSIAAALRGRVPRGLPGATPDPNRLAPLCSAERERVAGGGPSRFEVTTLIPSQQDGLHAHSPAGW